MSVGQKKGWEPLLYVPNINGIKKYLLIHLYLYILHNFILYLVNNFNNFEFYLSYSRVLRMSWSIFII